MLTTTIGRPSVILEMENLKKKKKNSPNQCLSTLDHTDFVILDL